MLNVICLYMLVSAVLSDNAVDESAVYFNKTETQQNASQLSIKEAIGRSASSNLTSVVTNVTFSDFKPSVPVDPFYERNKFTVPPAFPEAKIYSQPWKESSSSIPPWLENPAAQNNWKQAYWNDISATTETTFNKGVKFPSSEERPYKFESIYGAPAPVVTTERFQFDRPVNPEMVAPRNPRPTTGIGGFWNKLIGIGDSTNKVEHEPMQKTFFDYNLMEKPQPYAIPYDGGAAYGVTGHSGYRGYGGGYAEHEAYGGYSGGGYGKFGGIGHHVSPWKKIIKFLAAIIPIGLFLSALTPTVIHVQSVNDTMLTQSRYRTEETKDDLAHRLANSLSYFNKLNDDGCEDKVLCELLVSASLSKNSEENIKNLLDNFVKNEDLDSKKEDLLKIFDAVREQDCSPIVCKSIDNPS